MISPEDARQFLQAMPFIHATHRDCALHAVDVLAQLDVYLEGICYDGEGCLTLYLPLIQPLCGAWEIPMNFGFWSEDTSAENAFISCGPSTFDATHETVEDYISWLDKHMPRRGESLSDILRAGNPDGLVLPPQGDAGDVLEAEFISPESGETPPDEEELEFAALAATPTDKFRRALTFVLRWEGGYVNHPSDPGGATNKGVTQAVYDAYRKDKKLAKRSVKNITQAEVEDIYFTRYWTPLNCELLPSHLALAVFDYGVNSGINRSARHLREMLGLSVASTIDKPTREKVWAQKDYKALALKFVDKREAFLHAIIKQSPKFKVFEKGWMNRVSALRKEIKSW